MNSLWFVFGAAAGYLLMMRTNPARASLRDGWRILRRFPQIWVVLGLFGAGYSAFEIGLRAWFSSLQPAGESSLFIWSRAPFRPALEWFFGHADSLWYLPAGSARVAGEAARLPALDAVAELFNNLVSTFPVAAVAGLLFLVNWRGKQGVLFHALRRRFGVGGWFLHLATIVCALAAFLKPALYLAPGRVDPQLWIQWSPVVAWLAFLFEYLFGVYVQVGLLLLCYCWVRGVTFNMEKFQDFAVRRTSFVLRWALLVMALSSIFIDFPLILRNFTTFERWFPRDVETIDFRVSMARIGIDGVLIAFAAVQITLAFHSESLRKSVASHFSFLRRNAWAFIWLLVIAYIHLYVVYFLQHLSLAASGEGSALWVALKLLWPWVSAIVGGWLLASWACLFKRADAGRLADEDWIQY